MTSSPYDFKLGISLKILADHMIFMYDKMYGALTIIVPIYTILLITMGWRGIARVEGMNNIPKLLSGIGALGFVVSDSLYGVNRYSKPMSGPAIMTTYYMAQLGYTLSILDPDLKVNKIKNKE